MKWITAGDVRVGDLIRDLKGRRADMKIARVVLGHRPSATGAIIADPEFVMLRSDEPFFWWSCPRSQRFELVRRRRKG